MSKLLFVFEGDMPTISITRDVFSRLKNHPEIQSTFKYLTDVSAADIDSQDIIVFMRPMNIYSWRVAKKARKAGHVIISFCDDDLLNLPLSLPTIPWRKRGLLKCLEYSDVIWSSSRYIAERYRELTAGKRTVFMDTILQPEELQGIDMNRDDTGRIKIVYAAGGSHAELFEKHIKPIVPQLMNEFGDKISWTFVGVHPQMAGISCEYVSGMPLLEYRKYMRDQHFDIGLAPLENDEFSKCKYFNKFIEYTTQGIAGIYSNTEPYTYVVKNAENGLLADNSPEAWGEALRKLIKDKRLRRKCVQNAIDYLRTNHSEDAVISKLEDGVSEILEEKHNYTQCGRFETYKLLCYLSRIFDWLYMTGFYLRRTGIKDVLARAKAHIKGHAYSRRRTK